jgi:predicted nuclease of restriction endonuclease-like RecB superfamily
MKTKIFYSIENCGDGSAYPIFMESEELCMIEQEFMDEGWGEPCIGHITIEHDTPIKIKNEIKTVDEVIEETELRIKESCVSENSKHFLRKKLEELNKLKNQMVIDNE